jgi:iron complex outermembrane receptor protein
MKPLVRHLLQVLGTGVAVSVLTVPLALAQQGPTKIEKIEVTGSNIPRAQAETASPVQTVTRDDIEKSGKTTVAELLQTLALDNQGSVPMTFGNGFAQGASGLSLRGMGAASTLVLVNGRRVAPYGLADDGQKVFADLNMIPVEAIERVEILKDGASAIYGSDAIAGVVNIILRKDFQGTVVKASAGQSQKGDGTDTRLALTHGFGDIGTDKYNVLLNFEYGKKDPIWNSNRAGRDQIGRADLRDLGFSAQEALGGTGAITGNNASGSAINGNVRNPTTLDYYNRGNLAGVGFTRTFPGAACTNFTSHAQGDPGGGCLIDGAQQYGQIQPSLETFNFFGRGTRQLSADMQAYAELNLYKSESVSSGTPSGISGSVGYPGGPVSNSGVALGAAHPDNPYFGTAARLRYLAADVGPRVSDVESTFTRVVAGLKGTVADWDYDTAILASEDKVTNTRTGFLQRNVTFALLNPTAANVTAANLNPAYAALPAGSYWRIAENKGLNSAALYAALSPAISNDAKSSTTQLDFKASREIGRLEGGPMGLAVGAEVRHEGVRLDPTTGTDKGNIIGLGYSAYDGTRSVAAVYGELLAPVTKSLELSAAARGDHYSDVGNSFTPKVGAKWTPVKSLAVRATYSEGFRAPGAAENGKGGLAAFSTATDPLRCALGVAAACNPATVALITSPNANLQPEKSKSYTLGMIWDLLPKTSISVDLWQIDRKNEINQESVPAAIAAGHVARDPSTAQAGLVGDPGGIIAVLTNYVNSAQTRVQGVDFDFRQGFDLSGGAGKLAFDLKWTHLFKWLRTEKDGTQFDYAGTHGNCDVTNCIGTPANRANLVSTWEGGDLRVAAIINYRGSMENKNFKNDPAGCASAYANGNDAPAGCKIKAFTTVDLTVRWQATKKTEVFGSVQNLFDAVAPLDPLTYGATSYNPLDYSGAVGRFFNIGLRHKFQ